MIQLKDLWKATFHDSDEYVDMIFDHYYDPRLCLRYAESGRLISSAFMIPYALSDASTLGYVCGLATVPERRGEGIMRRLLELTEERAREEGFAGTFLIPADDGLREYYRRQGYCDTALVTKLRIAGGKAMWDMSDVRTMGDMRELCERGDLTYRGSSEILIEKCMEFERSRKGRTVVHGAQQWEDVIADIRRDGGEILSLGERAAVYRKSDGEVGRLFGSDEDLKALLSDLAERSEAGLLYRCVDAEEAEELRNSGVPILSEESGLYGMAKPAIPGLNLRLMLD